MSLQSEYYDLVDFEDVQEYFHDEGWTDGFPIVPPTPEAVQACLDWVNLPGDTLIGIEPVRKCPVSAEKLAINAVMAGCLPVHFPLVSSASDSDLQHQARGTVDAIRRLILTK